ncbi:YycH family regulatory protein [Virgibacillus halophilus]|uniref:Two-component system activity regulator YycH n=1 Tax=Tigheibacillus halophilus TaxID=361280 RepID=A0ABU5C5U9_9BACI|nr:two-component system activity regulator YycH [Virgibacillus halophilus]
MKFEVVKSYILVILVGMSLLLTFNIWSYKSDNELLLEKKGQYLNEADYYIEGDEQSKRDIVMPSEVIFQHQSKHYGYKNPKKSLSMYKNMQTWTLYDFKLRDLEKVPNEKYQLEFRFPTAIPMETIGNLFQFNDDIETGALGSFKRLFITFNPDKYLLRFHFLSLDGRKEATAVVNDATKYDYLWKLMSNLKGMQELQAIGPANLPVYFPSNPVQMKEHTFSVNNTNPKKLVNALFPDPSSVRRNVSNANEAYYTDAGRQMRVYQDRHVMDYINPKQTDTHRMTFYELLDKSILNINEHKGWTDDYYLDGLNGTNHTVTYLLHYDGYPVISQTGLATIEQQWRNQELYQYKRPLFSINNSLKSDTVTIPSGATVKEFVKENYKEADISDISIGYSMNFQQEEASSFILLLEPAWFIKYDGHWKEIDFTENKDGNPEVN